MMIALKPQRGGIKKLSITWTTSASTTALYLQAKLHIWQHINLNIFYKKIPSFCKEKRDFFIGKASEKNIHLMLISPL
jgi:hypothetical protein